jgi:hypothetical protein
MQLTDNERNALATLLKACLSNMGGKNMQDLRNDPFTYVDPTDLTHCGIWSKHEAAGTFGALQEKGMIEPWERKNEFVVTNKAIDWGEKEGVTL